MPINTEFFKFCAHLLKKQKFTISSQYEYFFFFYGCYDIVTIKKEVKELKNTKSAVLACVTSQYNCDRIIRIAKEIADSAPSDIPFKLSFDQKESLCWLIEEVGGAYEVRKAQ